MQTWPAEWLLQNKINMKMLLCQNMLRIVWISKKHTSCKHMHPSAWIMKLLTGETTALIILLKCTMFWHRWGYVLVFTAHLKTQQNCSPPQHEKVHFYLWIHSETAEGGWCSVQGVSLTFLPHRLIQHPQDEPDSQRFCHATHRTQHVCWQLLSARRHRYDDETNQPETPVTN